MLYKNLQGGSELHTFNPKSIYYKKNICNTDNLRDHILKIKKEKKLFRNDFIDIYTSHNTNYILEKDIIFNELFNKILNESKIFLLELGYTEEFINKIYVESSWFNIGKKGDSLIKHIHPGSFLSGAFYVSCDKDDQILFFSDDDMTMPPENFNDLSSKYMTFNCIKGSLLLFKSNINHCTNKQKSDEKITISFNLNFNKI